MDVERIFEDLASDDGLPKGAIVLARQHRAEIAPRFVREIDGFLAGGPEGRGDPMLLFFAVHLLGEWRETAAYRPILALLRRPRHEIEEILGDAVTTTVHRVVARLYDGDPRPIYDAILDPEADEFVRDAMCKTLVMLVREGALDRAEAASFLSDCFTAIEPQDTCYVWSGWQEAIAMLGLRGLQPLVKEAFDRKLIDDTWMGYHHFLKDLEAAENGRPVAMLDELYAPLDDVIEELGSWHGFSEDRSRARREETLERLRYEAIPAFNPHRNVGRNDPCPCGSGKKFKRCCLN